MSLDMTWICEKCHTRNNIQNGKCKICGEKIPESICEKIYNEELSLQKKFLKTEKGKKKKERLAKQDAFWKKYNASYANRISKTTSFAIFLKKSRVFVVLIFAILFCLQFCFLKSNNIPLHSLNITTEIPKKSEKIIEICEEKISVAKSRKFFEKYYEILQLMRERKGQIIERTERIFNNGN